MPLINPDALRQIMRRWITGVAIITSSDGIIRHGMTVNSLSSMSLDPPLVTVSLARGVRTQILVEKTRIFGLSFLSEDQTEVSDCFAGKIPDENDRFSGLEWYTLNSMAPLLLSGLAGLDCKVVHIYESTNSILYVGEVIAEQAGQPGEPLIYHNRGYHRIEK